jgi:hypothetical protein
VLLGLVAGLLRPNARDMFVLAHSKRIEMTLVKSLYSGDPDVIDLYMTVGAIWVKAEQKSAILNTPLLLKSMCQAACTHALGRPCRGPAVAPASAKVEVLNSQSTNCLDSSLGRASACGAGGRRFAPCP